MLRSMLIAHRPLAWACPACYALGGYWGHPQMRRAAGGEQASGCHPMPKTAPAATHFANAPKTTWVVRHSLGPGPSFGSSSLAMAPPCLPNCAGASFFPLPISAPEAPGPPSCSWRSSPPRLLPEPPIHRPLVVLPPSAAKYHPKGLEAAVFFEVSIDPKGLQTQRVSEISSCVQIQIETKGHADTS